MGLGLSLRVKCPARVPIAGQHSSVAVARNVLHLEAVPLTERSTPDSLSNSRVLSNRAGIPLVTKAVLRVCLLLARCSWQEPLKASLLRSRAGRNSPAFRRGGGEVRGFSPPRGWIPP